jgi:hypothetical protein
VGSWIRNCAAEPITAPHAIHATMSSSCPASRRPATTIAAMIAAFHTTGET